MPKRTTGSRGELLAEAFLKNKGFEILHRNWRSGRMEIDLIANHANTLVFIEVKTRNSFDFGFPEEAVTIHKQAHIRTAATTYLQLHPFPQARFDVVSILLKKGQPEEIVHYEDAFF